LFRIKRWAQFLSVASVTSASPVLASLRFLCHAYGRDRHIFHQLRQSNAKLG
jgi:hypothetical protein